MAILPVNHNCIYFWRRLGYISFLLYTYINVKKVQCYGYSNPFVQKITHGNYNRKNSNLNQIGNKGMIRKQSQYWAGLAMAAGGQRKEGCLIREWGA